MRRKALSITDVAKSPFHRLLQFAVTRCHSGEADLSLIARPELLRSADSDWLHGGVVASLIDIAGSYAVSSVTGRSAPTIDLRVDYLRPASGNIVAKSRTIRVGRTIAIADIEVRNSQDVLVAIGRGAFSVGNPVALEEVK